MVDRYTCINLCCWLAKTYINVGFVEHKIANCHTSSRLSELWYFNRKNKRPVHDLTPSICNMFAMCTSCREKRE